MGLSDTTRADLIFRTVIEGQENFKRMEHNMTQVRQQMGRMSKSVRKATMPLIKNALAVEEMRGQYDSFGGVMGMSQEKFSKFNKEGGKFNSAGGRIANKTRMMTQGLRGFRMELLGVMFFGMSMNKMLTGWLKPAAEVFGIFDLINVMLMIIFLNVMGDLFDGFMHFFKWVLTWSDDTKTFVGWFVVLAAVMFGVLFAIGMLGLGMGSLIAVFGAVGATAFVGTMSTLGLVFLGLVIIVATVITYHKHLERGMYSAAQAVIEYAYAFIRLAYAYAQWRATKWDPTGIWEKRANSTEQTMYSLQDASMEYAQKWAQVNAEIIAENEAQDNSNEDLKNEMIGYNKQVEDSNKGLLDTTKDLNQQTLDSQFTTYANMYKNQENFQGQMLEGTKTFVNDTNDALAKINSGGSSWGGSSGGGSSGGDNTYEGTPAVWKTPIGGDVGGGWKRVNDFIWRAGQGAVSINPNDNLIGTKNGMPNSGGSNVTYSPTYNINVSDKEEMEQMIDSNNKSIVDDLLRLVNPSGV